jgi:hypothetical protein
MQLSGNVQSGERTSSSSNKEDPTVKLQIPLLAAACGIAGVCLADSHSDNWTVRETETIEKTFTLSGAPMRLIVDNVDGYVHVNGSDGSEVRMTAHKSIRAETASDLQEAKNNIKLETSQKPGTVSIYYDAPWRCKGDHENCHGEQRHFYEVTYDIDLRVPHGARGVISTVNGDIRVDQLAEDYEIRGVNGGIRMTGMSGSGSVQTVNGPIYSEFAKNPARTTGFKSINGAIDIYFRPQLSADLFFKTFNGQIYTDFDVSPLAVASEAGERRGTKFVYRTNSMRSARVGQGGPELRFDSFNGNIRLHQNPRSWGENK